MEPDVKKVILDFEIALWKALKSQLPEVKLQGCLFHWTQAIWRKVIITD
jgi:transposase-like protein